jgi:hypothetical protein
MTLPAAKQCVGSLLSGNSSVKRYAIPAFAFA